MMNLVGSMPLPIEACMQVRYLSVSGKSADFVNFPADLRSSTYFYDPYSVVLDPLDSRNSEDGGTPGGPPGRC